VVFLAAVVVMAVIEGTETLAKAAQRASAHIDMDAEAAIVAVDEEPEKTIEAIEAEESEQLAHQQDDACERKTFS